MKPKVYLETSIVSYLTGYEPCIICTPEELLEE